MLSSLFLPGNNGVWSNSSPEVRNLMFRREFNAAQDQDPQGAGALSRAHLLGENSVSIAPSDESDNLPSIPSLPNNDESVLFPEANLGKLILLGCGQLYVVSPERRYLVSSTHRLALQHVANYGQESPCSKSHKSRLHVGEGSSCLSLKLFASQHH